MNKNIEIKNIKIGEGIPKICVPIVGRNDEEIISIAKKYSNINIDIIEWRIDFYKDVYSVDKVKELLSKVSDILKDKPLLFTFRSKKEGGEKELSVEKYIELNKEVIKTKLIDLIDIELFTGDNYVKEIVDLAYTNDIKTVISNHDFKKTPKIEEIINRIKRMIKLKGDIPKVAVMPNTSEDVLKLLEATNRIKKEFPDKAIITMSMGKLGMISRISGETFGSSVTFGCIENASAPGQVEFKQLKNILELMHR